MLKNMLRFQKAPETQTAYKEFIGYHYDFIIFKHEEQTL